MYHPSGRPPRRRGVTLIEAVLFISVALGLIVGGLVFYQQASLSARVNQQVRVLSGIVAETRALFQNIPNIPSAPNIDINDASTTTIAFSGAGQRIFGGRTAY